MTNTTNKQTNKQTNKHITVTKPRPFTSILKVPLLLLPTKSLKFAAMDKRRRAWQLQAVRTVDCLSR